MELFEDELCEIEDTEEKIRYILRRNPRRADEIRNNRQVKINSLQKKIANANDYLAKHKRSKTSAWINTMTDYVKKLKLDKFIDIFCDENSRILSFQINEEERAKLEQLDGCYVIKTDLPKNAATKETIHQRYKSLSEVEHGFRTFKTGHLEVRPIFVRKRERTIAHLFITMLAYKIERFLRSAWRDLDLTVAEGIAELSSIVIPICI